MNVIKAAKIIKKSNPRILSGILIAILVAIAATAAFTVFFVIKPVSDEIEGMSAQLGSDIGKSVGWGVGPILGGDDFILGLNEGREEGLSAKDTNVSAESLVTSLGYGKLEVLIAQVKEERMEYYPKGNIIDPSYVALYVYGGELIFTVDLNEVRVSHYPDRVLITIPKPEAKLVMDESQTKRLAYYQSVASIFSSTEDGMEGTINSRTEIENKSAEELKEFDGLFGIAKDEAKTRIEYLAESVLTDKTKKIEVIMKGE